MCINLGKPIPDKLANPPQIALGTEFYIGAYFELDTERSKSMGTERIPFSSILYYGQYMGFIDDALDDFVYLMRAIDNAMLKQENETKS